LPNIFQMILNSIIRMFVNRGIRSGIDYFNGSRRSGSALPPNTRQPLPDDTAARRARNKARRQGR